MHLKAWHWVTEHAGRLGFLYEHKEDLLQRFTLGKPSKCACVGVSMSEEMHVCCLGRMNADTV